MIMHPRITIIEITQQNTFLVINARTGKLKPSLRTFPIYSVSLFVPGDLHQIDVKTEDSDACESTLSY